MQYTVDVLYNWPLVTYIILLTNVSPVSLIKFEKERGRQVSGELSLPGAKISLKMPVYQLFVLLTSLMSYKSTALHEKFCQHCFHVWSPLYVINIVFVVIIILLFYRHSWAVFTSYSSMKDLQRCQNVTSSMTSLASLLFSQNARMPAVLSVFKNVFKKSFSWLSCTSVDIICISFCSPFLVHFLVTMFSQCSAVQFYHHYNAPSFHWILITCDLWFFFSFFLF